MLRLIPRSIFSFKRYYKQENAKKPVLKKRTGFFGTPYRAVADVEAAHRLLRTSSSLPAKNLVVSKYIGDKFVIGHSALVELDGFHLVACRVELDDLPGALVRGFFQNVQYLHEMVLRL
jgi:hypothetical protein